MNSSLWDAPVPAGLAGGGPAPADGAGAGRTVRLGSGSQPVPQPRPVPLAGVAVGFPPVPGYDILDVIGTGGMGIVYKARHRELNRVVALKMLGRQWETDRDSRERFRTEAEAVAKLQHPNIIQLFDIGACDRGAGVSHPYMTLEYVEGGSLARFAGSPQDPRLAADMVGKLARAAGAAHKVGVVHRDLKPANVLLTAAGEPKVADFGLAKQLEPPTDGSGHYQTQAGTVVGTPEYMAPEQVDGKPPTPAVDVYALGVILYELLTGRVPLKGASLTETLLMARLGEPVPPRRLQPTLPRDLDTICLKCLEKSADKRYATAEELADDLDRWAEAKPIRARPAGRVERAVRWVRRNPTVTGLIALSVLLFTTGLTAVVWKWAEAETNAATARQTVAVERWERYRADIRAGAGALEQGNTAAARRALEDAPSEHRDWEWHVLDAQLDVSSRVYRVPKLEGVHFVPGSGRAIVRGSDESIRTWDLATGAEVGTPDTRAGAVYWGIDAPAGRMAVVGADHVIRIRPIGGGPEKRLAGHADAVNAVHFTDGGRRILSSSKDRTVRAWDLDTERLVASYRHTDSLFIHNVTADGARAVVSTPDRSTVAIWNTVTGTFSLLGDGRFVVGGDFTPDGQLYVAGAEYPANDLRLFDGVTGAWLADLKGHENTTNKCALGRNGTRLVTGSMDRTACLWDVAGRKIIATLRGHGGWVTAVAFSKDGTRVATGSTDKTVRLWTEDGKLLAVLRGHDGDVQELAFAADGAELYSSSAADGTIRTWDVPTAERRGLLRGHADFVYDVAHHPDNRRVLSASWDGTAALWDTVTGKRVRQYVQPDPVGNRGPKSRVNYVNSVAIHPNGTLAATASRLDTLALWDLTDPADRPRPLHAWNVPTDDWRVCRVAFSPTGTLLACGGKDGKLRLFDWQAKEADPVAKLTLPGDVAEAVAFSPDGTWLVASSAEFVRVWEVSSLRLVTELQGHKEGVNGFAFSADGRTLASASSEGTVRLWNVAGWTERAVLRHGSVKVYSVAFHPDGHRLATGCSDSSIRLWDVQRAQEVAELRGHEEYVHGVAFSPDGKRLVSGSGDKTLRVWDTTTVRAVGR